MFGVFRSSKEKRNDSLLDSREPKEDKRGLMLALYPCQIPGVKMEISLQTRDWHCSRTSTFSDQKSVITHKDIIQPFEQNY